MHGEQWTKHKWMPGMLSYLINGHNYHIKIAPIIHSYISNLLSPSSPSFTLLVRMQNGSTGSIVCLDKYWMIMARV